MILASTSFFALTIFGLGAVSVLTNADIIAVPGLGQLPGVAGMLVAAASFALLLWTTLRRQHPSFVATVAISLSTALVHLAALWAVVLITAGDAVVATVVGGDLVRGGASAVVLLAAAIAAWGGIALRRTRAKHPRWPWERDDEE